MPAMTRGPLPPRVYWVRRLLVATTAVLLVVGIARLLGNGSDASSDPDDRAAQTAAQTTAETTPDAAASAPLTDSAGTDPTRGAGKPGKKGTTSSSEPTQPVLAAPQGECVGSDVAVTPKISQAVAGRDVLVVLQLRTLTSEACTWKVSPRALTLDITSGKDDIWSSRQCPRAIPVRDVVVRQDVTTNVGIVWKQAKRSGDRCVIGTDWAYPGFYHVTAAALGGEPSDVQFELTTPTAATITKTATPTNSPSGSASGKPSGKPSGKASGKPSGKPSGSPSGSPSSSGR